LLLRCASEEFLNLGTQALLLMQASLVLRVHLSLSVQLLAFLELQVLLEESLLLHNGGLDLRGDNGFEVSH